LWLIKHWFSASTFVVKIATFAKPENVIGNPTAELEKLTNRNKKSKWQKQKHLQRQQI
jgi:hypothetical protein